MWHSTLRVEKALSTSPILRGDIAARGAHNYNVTCPPIICNILDKTFKMEKMSFLRDEEGLAKVDYVFFGVLIALGIISAIIAPPGWTDGIVATISAVTP